MGEELLEVSKRVLDRRYRECLTRSKQRDAASYPVMPRHLQRRVGGKEREGA